MEISKRDKKRYIIIAVYMTLFFLLMWWIYGMFKPEDTCTDGKKNQNETGVDCGGVCKMCPEKVDLQNLLIMEKAFVFGGQGKFDVMMKVKNPNGNFGAERFSYKFTLKDESGATIAEKSGIGFILPLEEKYLVETGLEAGKYPSSIEAEVGNISWKEFVEYKEAPRINIYQKKYDIISGGTGYSKLYGLVRNESLYDFNLIRIKTVLRGEDGIPVAINSTEMRTVRSGEQRDFTLVWPASFPGEVKTVDAQAEADIFDNQNFIRTYYSGTERFQELGR